MKIGIIGTGNIGGTLASKLVQAGHDISVANSRGIDGVQAFADQVGAQATDVHGAVKDQDIIILSVPMPAMEKLPAGLFEGVSSHVPVIDTSNYYPGMRDPNIAAIDDGQAESLWVSERIGRKVVKAFNNILAYSLENLGQPETSQRLAIAVAGDDADTKAQVMELVNSIGFEPVDAGSLADSWRQQPSTPAYCCDWNAQEMQEALACAVKGKAQYKRDKLPEHFLALGSNPTHSDVIKLNRSINTAS